MTPRRSHVDEAPQADPVVEAPVVDAPVEAPVEAPEPVKAAPAKKHAPKPANAQGGFEGDPDDIHRLYFVPPAGYQKPKFPSSI